MSVVVRGEWKGQKMIYIYKDQADADAAARGERVFSLFQVGIKKANVIMAHLPAMLKFVTDEGEVSVKVIEALKGLK
jgi:hypothetical protein